MGTMFGCCSCAAVSASSWKRLRKRGLAAEVGIEHLDRDEALERALAGEEHGGHAALPEQAQDLVVLAKGGPDAFKRTVEWSRWEASRRHSRLLRRRLAGVSRRLRVSQPDRRARGARAPVVTIIDGNAILCSHGLHLPLRLLQLRAVDDRAAGHAMPAPALHQPEHEGDTSEQAVPRGAMLTRVSPRQPR